MAVIALVFVFDGNIEYRFGEDSFTVHTALLKDITVNYADILNAQLTEIADKGKRTNGYGSGKMSLGSFQNEEFGNYLLYSYNYCDESVLIFLKDGSVLVIGAENPESTNELYQNITAVI